MKTVQQLGLGHSECNFSTSIGEYLTAGQGKLDNCGHFEIECPECADRVQEEIDAKYAITSKYLYGFKSKTQLYLFMVWREDYQEGELLGASVVFSTRDLRQAYFWKHWLWRRWI